jgi:hypothetical protein
LRLQFSPSLLPGTCLPITARISIIARGEAFWLSRQSGKHPATRNQKKSMRMQEQWRPPMPQQIGVSASGTSE